MASRFNLNKAKVGGGSPSTKLPPGEYILRIEKCFDKDSENKQIKAGPYFIAEFTVVKVVSGGKQYTDKHGNFYPETKDGDYRSWSNDMSHAQGPASLNAFLCAAAGTDPTDPEAIKEADYDFDELCEEVLGSENPARGEYLRDVVSAKPSGKDKKNEFMLNTFAVATEADGK